MSDAKLNAELEREERRIKHELENWQPRAGDELFVSTPNSVVVDCT